MQTEEEFLSKLLDDIQSNRITLPTLPEVALRVRDVVEDENASAGQIAKIVGTDAALSARLIQVANSPLYRARSPIDNIQIAIARMGNTVVRNLVTSLVMQQMFQATSEVTDKRLRGVWEHSTQVAAISHVLAAQFTRLKPDEAMLAGLVHDLGALPILVTAEDTPELLEDEPLLDRLIADLHPQVGKVMMETWNFPPELVAVAAEHEDLERDPGPQMDYVDVVQVANLQCYVGSEHPHASVDLSSVPAFAKMGLNPEVSVVNMEGVGDDIEEVQELLRA